MAAANGAGAAPAHLDHAAEVNLFASTLATVKVVTGAYPDMLANAAYLAGLRDRLHMSDADKPAFAKEGNAVAAMLGQGLRSTEPGRLVRGRLPTLRPGRLNDSQPISPMN